MAKITLYDSENVTLWYHPDTKIVHHQVHKFVHGEEFHKFLLLGTEAIRKNHAQKWLSDDRSNTVLKQEDMDWGAVNWFPPTIQGGWKYWAIVQPQKAIAQMNMEELAKMYSSMGITAKFFTDADVAMKWLESL